MGPRMRVIFAGTPAFAASALSALIRAGFDIPLVLTQPDRPAGRGMKMQASAVKQLALSHGIQVIQPAGLKRDGRYADDAESARQALLEARADVMVVVAYGLILPAWVLDLPRIGCLNVHASLLPRWRGAAPIHRAIEAGDSQTGVTIMQMDEGLDTGDMLLCESVAIHAQDTTGSLHDRLASLGGRLIVEALELAACGGLTPRSQPQDGVTYASKIDKAESLIDWSEPAVQLQRRLRAFDPFPGMVTWQGADMIKVWAAQCDDQVAPPSAAPGTVLDVSREGIAVATGDGVLRLTELQRAGGKRLPATEFLTGHAMRSGVHLGPPPVTGA